MMDNTDPRGHGFMGPAPGLNVDPDECGECGQNRAAHPHAADILPDAVSAAGPILAAHGIRARDLTFPGEA